MYLLFNWYSNNCSKQILQTDYTLSDCYYTQIPRVDVNRESWLIDDFGHKQPIGKEYVLVCYNALGESMRVTFYSSRLLLSRNLHQVKNKEEDSHQPKDYI